MKLVSKLSVATGVVALAMVPIAYAVDVSQVYVTPENELGWVDISTLGGLTEYVDDAPINFGTSSMKLSTDTSRAARTGLTRADLDQLSTYTELGYRTKVVSAYNFNQTADMQIHVSLDGDDFGDTMLTYSPGLQPNGTYVAENQWQYWDASDGWFTSRDTYGSGDTVLKGDGSLYKFSDIKAWYPMAKVLMFGIIIEPISPYTNVYIDGVEIGSTVYDFERVAPTGGGVVDVPKTILDCKDYGWETMFKTDGSPFRNQGQCVSYIVSSKAKVK